MYTDNIHNIMFYDLKLKKAMQNFKLLKSFYTKLYWNEFTIEILEQIILKLLQIVYIYLLTFHVVFKLNYKRNI